MCDNIASSNLLLNIKGGLRVDRKILYTIVLSLFICSLPQLSCKRSTPISTDVAILSKMVAPHNKSEVKSLHQKHEDAEVKCVVCHHKKDNDDRIKKCVECHESDEQAVIDRCVKCHEEKNKLL